MTVIEHAILSSGLVGLGLWFASVLGEVFQEMMHLPFFH